MYEATKAERRAIINQYECTNREIDRMDELSDKVRRGFPIGLIEVEVVCHYQDVLKSIRKASKKWWQFWKK